MRRLWGPILVTGGAGFIGCNLVRRLLAEGSTQVVNLDSLTYAGNLESLRDVEQNPRYTFVRGDICDRETLAWVFSKYEPVAVAHLAAETHVDRSIAGPEGFVRTNVLGTQRLLDEARGYWESLESGRKGDFLFLVVSFSGISISANFLVISIL